MSKKCAENLDALLLDVKVGSGAMMREERKAQTLAKRLVMTMIKLNSSIDRYAYV